MKNVLIFNVIEGKERYDFDLLHRYLRAQIDNSLRLGWKKDDIILGTNFKFSYNGITSTLLQDVTDANIYNNKWYGLNELTSKAVLQDDFWFHDQDSWQIERFDFPLLNKPVGGCTYVHTPEWNTSSMFFTRESGLILNYIREFLEKNLHLNLFGDENYIAILRRHTPVGEYFQTLDNQYNVGCTHFEKRYENAKDSVKICGFKPHLEKDCKIFEGKNKLNKNFLNKEILDIFKENNIYYK